MTITAPAPLASTPVPLLGEDFIPGSITDICGICHERFELQRDPRQYHTVETLEGELWDLICDECQDRIGAGEG